jgi:protein SCO1/2
VSAALTARAARARVEKMPSQSRSRIGSAWFSWRACVGLALLLVVGFCVAGCSGSADETGSFPAANNADCLPNLTLVDQRGDSMNLASLKGQYVLIDFIYTSCAGTCPMLTSKMEATQQRLAPDLAGKVRLVSVTLDPEHDNPAQLLKYADAHGAKPGWLFLTGTPAQIDGYLAIFRIKRSREPSGAIDHVTTSFLLGPDGHQIRQYDGIAVKPETMAADVGRALSNG